MHHCIHVVIEISSTSSALVSVFSLETRDMQGSGRLRLPAETVKITVCDTSGRAELLFFLPPSLFCSHKRFESPTASQPSRDARLIALLTLFNPFFGSSDTWVSNPLVMQVES